VTNQTSSTIDSKKTPQSRFDLNTLPKEPTLNKPDSSKAFKFLRGIDTFSQLPESELKAIADFSLFEDLEPGQYITIEGDEASAYGFIVISGCLAMTKTSISGKDLIVELLQADDIFGLLIMLAAEKLPAQLSARALKKSKIIWVPSGNFISMLKINPSLLKDYVAHLILCLQSSYSLSRGLAHDRVEVRIASVLSSLALKFAKSSPADGSYTIKFTRHVLADITGTTTETAIRVTRAMQRAGLIDIKLPGVIRILNQKALSEIVEA